MMNKKKRDSKKNGNQIEIDWSMMNKNLFGYILNFY